MNILITGGSGFIGTNLAEYYSDNHHVISLDIVPPRNISQKCIWEICDIRDFNKLKRIAEKFEPDCIFHMAADTGLEGRNLDDYSSNILGVQNLLLLGNEITSVKKIVFASTMLVCEVGYLPKNEKDYCPTTLYGESKMIGEKLVREFDANFKWSIVRPTSIWGPWFGRTYREFFEMIIKGTYVNFTGKMCEKTYGYIGNVVYQLDEILKSDASNSKTLYVGDYEPIRINEWAKEIGAIADSKVPTVPFFTIKWAALLGDVLSKLDVRFPMNSFRLKNMTTDNILDLSETQKIAPETPFARETGIELTIDWMKKSYKPNLFS